jgi:hypothetical protein
MPLGDVADRDRDRDRDHRHRDHRDRDRDHRDRDRDRDPVASKGMQVCCDCMRAHACIHDCVNKCMQI